MTVKFEPFIPKGYRVGSYLFDPTNEIEATLAPDKSYEGQVGIYVSSGRVAEIKNAVTDDAAFTAQVETVTPGKEFKLLVKSADKLPVGTHKLLVKLTTDDPNQETLEVSFLLKVGNATATPAPVKSPAPAQRVSKKPTPKNKPKR